MNNRILSAFHFYNEPCTAIDKLSKEVGFRHKFQSEIPIYGCQDILAELRDSFVLHP